MQPPPSGDRAEIHEIFSYCLGLRCVEQSVNLITPKGFGPNASYGREWRRAVRGVHGRREPSAVACRAGFGAIGTQISPGKPNLANPLPVPAMPSLGPPLPGQYAGAQRRGANGHY